MKANTHNHYVIKMERGGFYNGIDNRYVTVVENVQEAHVLLTRQIAEDVLSYLHNHAMYCYGTNHEIVPIKDKTGLPLDVQKMIRVFKVSKPFELEYSYRTKRGKADHQKDAPVLTWMIEEGMVKKVSKSTTKILYRLIREGKEVQP